MSHVNAEMVYKKRLMKGLDFYYIVRIAINYSKQIFFFITVRITVKRNKYIFIYTIIPIQHLKFNRIYSKPEKITKSTLI